MMELNFFFSDVAGSDVESASGSVQLGRWLAFRRRRCWEFTRQPRFGRIIAGAAHQTGPQQRLRWRRWRRRRWLVRWQEAQKVRRRSRWDIAAGSVENNQARAEWTRFIQVGSYVYLNPTLICSIAAAKSRSIFKKKCQITQKIQ